MHARRGANPIQPSLRTWRQPLSALPSASSSAAVQDRARDIGRPNPRPPIVGGLAPTAEITLIPAYVTPPGARTILFDGQRVSKQLRKSLSPAGPKKGMMLLFLQDTALGRLSLLTYNENERHLATLSRSLDPRCPGLCAQGPAHHGRRRLAPGVPAAGPRGSTDCIAAMSPR
jgi:hypothetical protein